MRINFRVLAAGIATDGTEYQGQSVEFYFRKEEGLVPGDVFSAEIFAGSENDIDPSSIFVEAGPSAGRESRERPEFESVGATDRTGSWRPQGTPDTGLGGGKPHDGRFSHPLHHIPAE